MAAILQAIDKGEAAGTDPEKEAQLFTFASVDGRVRSIILDSLYRSFRILLTYVK
jgi:hypothetical protein